MVLALYGAAPARAETTGPSFDCTKANRVIEAAICDANELRAYDWWLAAIYGDALALAAPERAAELKEEQRDWLKERDDSCELDKTPMPPPHVDKQISCLMGVYDKRIQAIAARSIDPIWKAAAGDPVDALDRLRPLHSPLAARYAGILTHAQSDEPVTDFVSFAEAELGPEWSLSPFTGEIHIPCGLVEWYPRLLLVSRPFNGSSADSLLPDIDCGWDAYQEYPEPVATFLKDNPLTLKNWFTRCYDEGTIFRAYARDSWLRALRLARFPRSYLSDRITWLMAPEKPWPSGAESAADDWAQASDFKAAKDALADLYRGRFGLSQTEAETAAERALYDNRNQMDRPESCSFGGE
jgi:uncharacterized protein YecT (DUF1311 family)